MKPDVFEIARRVQYGLAYSGRPIIKNPFDLAIYTKLIPTLDLDTIIEIGCYKGGSALFLAELAPRARIYAIDKHLIGVEHPRIKEYDCGFEGFEARGDLGRTLVIEDASHTYRCTLACLEKFAPLVTLGSYYIVEDGVLGDPVRAIHEFLPGSGFEIDRSLCDLFGESNTFNTDGYLRRVR